MARPKKSEAEKVVPDNVSLTGAQWEWLSLWLPSGNPSERVRALLDRSMKFWPEGPDRPNPSGAKAGARPGGVRDLKRQVKALRQQLQDMGVEPKEVP